MRYILILLFLLVPIISYSDYLYGELEAGYEEYFNNYYSIFTIGYWGNLIHIYTGIDTIVNKHDGTNFTFYPVLTTYFICGEINIINGANIITTIGVYHQCSHRSEEGSYIDYFVLPTFTRYYTRIRFKTR